MFKSKSRQGAQTSPADALIRVHGPNPVFVRSSIGERILDAQVLLPRGLRLVVTHGCPDPAHATGHAADITLEDRWGRELDLGPRTGFVPAGTEAAANRALLAHALTGVGLACDNWWHWSLPEHRTAQPADQKLVLAA